MRFLSLMLFPLIFSHSAAAQEKIAAVKPPEVKRGDPITFSYKEHDVKEWLAETDKKSWEWFKMDKGNWYVNWDLGRKPFTTLVIHHSATNKEATAADIEKIQQERLYAPRYKSKSKQPFVRGLPVHSAHVVNGKERFIGYHHLIYHDGKVTTELSPLKKVGEQWVIDHVAWHAGNWDVNCSSVAICLIGDFSENEPPEKQLKATAGLLAHYRTINPKVTITSHGDHTKTECPGKTWRLWKEKIMP